MRGVLTFVRYHICPAKICNYKTAWCFVCVYVFLAHQRCIYLLPPRSRLYPDQMVTAATRIKSVSRSDGGSAPRDNLYSPEHQRRPGQLDEPQRQIPSRPCLLDGHQDEISGIRWVLCTIWLRCSLDLNCWFCMARGEWHYFDRPFPRLNTVKLI